MTKKVTSNKSQVRSLFFGGILPVVAYTIVEEVFGLLWGLVAGMVLAAGEIVWEWRKHGKVDAITWAGGSILLFLGTVSLLTTDGNWFKLQPAILEGIMGTGLIISFFMKKPFLNLLARKQNLFDQMKPAIRPIMEKTFSGLTLRIGFFFLLHTALATWAAFDWSTRSWALLKGVGFTVSLIVYMLIEMFFMRRKIRKKISDPEFVLQTSRHFQKIDN